MSRNLKNYRETLIRPFEVASFCPRKIAAAFWGARYGTKCLVALKL